MSPLVQSVRSLVGYKTAVDAVVYKHYVTNVLCAIYPLTDIVNMMVTKPGYLEYII